MANSYYNSQKDYEQALIVMVSSPEELFKRVYGVDDAMRELAIYSNK